MLLCFTASHRTADFDLLERLERHAGEVDAALRSRPDAFAGSVVLATCNRFEAYVEVAAPSRSSHAQAAQVRASRVLTDALSEATGIAADELAARSALVAGDEVAGHLFSVASGLESLVVGEGEIAGQVRRSLERARTHGSASRELERLFQNASRVSREVKNGSNVHSAGRSLVRLALQLADSRIVNWSEAGILLVGTGNYAATALKALRERGARNVHVWSRTGRASSFALKHDVEAVDRDGLVEAVATSDLVITCSVAPTVLLDRMLVEQASRSPQAVVHRLVVDLGLPRNVDREVAWVTGTELLDLETIGLHAPLEDFTATDRARTIVNDAAADYAAKGDERAAEPAVVALREHVFGVLEAEIARTRRGDGTSSDEVERALRHFAGVLLHTPSQRARELSRMGDANTFAAGVFAVFGADVPSVSETSATLRIVADEHTGTEGATRA